METQREKKRFRHESSPEIFSPLYCGALSAIIIPQTNLYAEEGSYGKNLNNSHAMGTDSITRLMWRFSLPAIVGMLANALYNIVDRLFVGQTVAPRASARSAWSSPL